MNITDVRIALHLLRGSGKPDWVRHIAMVLGIGLALLATFVGLSAPLAASRQHAVDVARSPSVGSRSNDNALELRSSTSTLGERVWTRVSASGLGLDSPKPPGVTAWPAPGETLVSPALRRMAEADPAVARMLGRLAPATITAAGLESPDELYSYARSPVPTVASPGVDPSQQSTAVVRFGDSSESPPPPMLMTSIEIGVLVLVPAVLFLLTTLRLSAVSRRKRTHALLLAGMSPSRATRLYTWEMTAVAVAGITVAVGAFVLVEPVLGSSGLLGIRWWPGQGALPMWAFVLIATVGVFAVRSLAKAGMRAAVGARSRQAKSSAPWRAWTAASVGLPSLSGLIAVCGYGLARPTTAWASGPHAAMIAGAIVGALVAVIYAATRFFADLASLIAPALRAPYALGLRGAAYRSASTGRLVSFVAGAVVLAGLSAAFVEALHAAAFGDPARARIAVSLSDVTRASGWRSKLPPYPFTIDTTVAGAGGPYAVTVGDCAAVEREAAEVFLHPGPCSHTIQRASGGVGGGTVRTLEIGATRVFLPPSTTFGGFTWDLKFPVRDAPWLGDLSQGQLTFWVSKRDSSFASAMSDLLQQFPGIPVDAGVKDPVRYVTYLHQVGTIRAATALGVLLSVSSFVLTALENRWRRRRSVAALAALGARPRALRQANAAEFFFPVLVAAVPASIVSTLGGWAILSFWGTAGMFADSIPLWAGTSALTVITIAGVVGWFTGWSKFQREELADS